MFDEDFTVEPVNGLPEALPHGEELLWQGRPAVLPLARESMWLNWVLGYFAVVAAWRALASSADMALVPALGTAVPFLILGALAGAIILGIAWLQARATVYSITTERVAMRIGAALTLTLNLPFPKVASANLDLRKGGTGTIALHTMGDVRLSHLVMWPHVRPWRMKQTEPALRCIPDAESVSQILADAAQTRVSQPVIARAPVAGTVAAE